MYRISHQCDVILLHIHVRFNRPTRDSVLFYRDLDIALSLDRQIEEHGAEKLQSVQQTPAGELKGRLTSMVREYDQSRPVLE